jgi:hypothetical protein
VEKVRQFYHIWTVLNHPETDAHKPKTFLHNGVALGINGIKAKEDFPEPERPVITTSFSWNGNIYIFLSYARELNFNGIVFV